MLKTLEKIEMVDNLWDKATGVMFWKDFGKINGLLLTKTNWIHTFLVRFPLDLVFLNKDYQIVTLVKNLKPFRISPLVWQAQHTLEMPSGSIGKHKLAVGDKLILK